MTGGVTWSADQYFTGGEIGSFYHEHPPVDITNTDDDVIYLTERSQYNTSFSCDLLVPNGTYAVRLHLAELWWTLEVFTATLPSL